MFSKGNIKRTLLNYAIYLIMLVMIIVIIAIEPSFLSLTQVSNILAQSSSRIIIALGVGVKKHIRASEIRIRIIKHF